MFFSIGIPKDIRPDIDLNCREPFLVLRFKVEDALRNFDMIKVKSHTRYAFLVRPVWVTIAPKPSPLIGNFRGVDTSQREVTNGSSKKLIRCCQS